MHSSDRLADIRAFDYYIRYSTQSRVPLRKSGLSVKLDFDFKRGKMKVEENQEYEGKYDSKTL